MVLDQQLAQVDLVLGMIIGGRGKTELNRMLEGVMATLWEETVVRPPERLSDESAGELAADTRPRECVNGGAFSGQRSGVKVGQLC